MRSNNVPKTLKQYNFSVAHLHSFLQCALCVHRACAVCAPCVFCVCSVPALLCVHIFRFDLLWGHAMAAAPVSRRTARIIFGCCSRDDGLLSSVVPHSGNTRDAINKILKDLGCPPPHLHLQFARFPGPWMGRINGKSASDKHGW